MSEAVKRCGAKKRVKKRVLAALSIVITVALVAWLVGRIDVGRSVELVRASHKGWLALAFVITLCIPVCTTFRWLGVLKAQAEGALPFGTALRAVMMANVLNSFMPSKAGDMAKAVYLRKHVGLTRGVGTVVLERMVDLSIIGLLGVLGYFRSGAVWGLYVGGALLVIIAGVFVTVLFFPFHRLPLPGMVLEKLDGLRSIFPRWLKNPAAMAQTIAGSAANWTLAGLTICALVSALGAPVGWGYAYSIFPLAILSGLVVPSISGIGPRDSAMAQLLAAHVSLEAATLVGLGYTFFAYWLLSLISFPFVAYEVLAFVRGEKGELAQEGTEAAGAE